VAVQEGDSSVYGMLGDCHTDLAELSVAGDYYDKCLAMTWCTRWNTALWLAEKVALLCDPSLNLQVMGVYQPITGLYFTWYIEAWLEITTTSASPW